MRATYTIPIGGGFLAGIDLGIQGFDDVERIGSGGSATVYRARQISLDRLVAIKVLRAAGDPDVGRRFDRERLAMGRLSQHDAVVTVFDTGETDAGDPYIIMEYLVGGSLQDELARRGRLPAAEVVEIISSAGRGIAHAHDEQVLHRDIKPGNLLRSGRGDVRVADFGIASFMSTDSTASSKTFSLTPAFSPPETFAGEPASVQGDVYSLAATTFALLAGRQPFTKGDSTDNPLSLMKRIAEDPVPLLGVDVEVHLNDAIRKGMAKSPSERHQSVSAFVAHIQGETMASGPAILPAGDTTEAAPGRSIDTEAAPDSARRRRTRAAILVASIAVVIGGGVAAALAVGGDSGLEAENLLAVGAVEADEAESAPTSVAPVASTTTVSSTEASTTDSLTETSTPDSIVTTTSLAVSEFLDALAVEGNPHPERGDDPVQQQAIAVEDAPLTPSTVASPPVPTTAEATVTTISPPSTTTLAACAGRVDLLTATDAELRAHPVIASFPTYADNWVADILGAQASPFGSYSAFSAVVDGFAAAHLARSSATCLSNGVNLSSALPSASCAGASFDINTVTSEELDGATAMSAAAVERVVENRPFGTLDAIFAIQDGPWIVDHLARAGACLSSAG